MRVIPFEPMHLLPLFSAGTNLLKVSGGGVHLSIFRLSPEAVAHRFPSLLYLIILRRCAGFWWFSLVKANCRGRQDPNGCWRRRKAVELRLRRRAYFCKFHAPGHFSMCMICRCGAWNNRSGALHLPNRLRF